DENGDVQTECRFRTGCVRDSRFGDDSADSGLFCCGTARYARFLARAFRFFAEASMTLCLATPVRAAELMTAQVSLGYALFRERLARLMTAKYEFVFSLDVVRARNRIVGTILREPTFADVTYVLWVDDDQWPDDPNIVPKMMQACKGVLG